MDVYILSENRHLYRKLYFFLVLLMFRYFHFVAHLCRARSIHAEGLIDWPTLAEESSGTNGFTHNALCLRDCQGNRNLAHGLFCPSLPLLGSSCNLMKWMELYQHTVTHCVEACIILKISKHWKRTGLGSFKQIQNQNYFYLPISLYTSI